MLTQNSKLAQQMEAQVRDALSNLGTQKAEEPEQDEEISLEMVEEEENKTPYLRYQYYDFHE